MVACTVPVHTAQLAGGPEPVKLTSRPGEMRPGVGGAVAIESPTADSIALESPNGVDRYWSAGPVLRVRLDGDFGDSVPATRYAIRRKGRLLDMQKKPARISACRAGRCRDFYHEFPFRLPERNGRSVAVTAGWNTVFARRAITGSDRTVLFKEVLNNTVWSLQAELAAAAWSAQMQGFYGPDGQGGSLDLSRVIKGAGEGVSYGIAMHLGLTRTDWLPDGSHLPTDRTVYHASVGPSIMVKGITASTQIGIYADGKETLQVSSTRISANGNLTTVRYPILVTAEKTFSFGGGPIVSRRRDAVERVTAGVYLWNDFAVKVGATHHRSAWPVEDPADDLQASELLLTLGGQYSLSW